MNERQIDILNDAMVGDVIEKNVLTSDEKEVALKILSELNGTLVIRATVILDFCSKAIQYSKVD